MPQIEADGTQGFGEVCLCGFFGDIQDAGDLLGGFPIYTTQLIYLSAFFRQFFYNPIDIVIQQAGIDFFIVRAVGGAENAMQDVFSALLLVVMLKYGKLDGGGQVVGELVDFESGPSVPKGDQYFLYDLFGRRFVMRMLPGDGQQSLPVAVVNFSKGGFIACCHGGE